MDEFRYTADMIRVVNLENKNLRQVLETIETHRYLAMEEASLSNLSSFLHGWLVGRTNTEDYQLLNEFQEFVAKEFRESSAAGWCRIIRKHRGEEQALASFFELFKKFLASRGR